jgi:thiol reductant ABC exporter CydD subunit
VRTLPRASVPLLDRLLPGERAARRLVPGVLAGALGGAAVVVQAALLSRAVEGAFLGGAGSAAIAPLLAALAGVAVLRAALAWAQEVLAQRASASVRETVRDRLVRRLLALGPRFASGERTGELAHTLGAGIEALDAYVAQYLPAAALAAIVPLLVLAAVIRVDPLSGLVLLVTGPLVPLFTWLIGSAAQERTRRQWRTLSRLSARFFDALSALPTLRAFGAIAAETAALERTAERHRETTLGVLRLAFVSSFVLEALATLGTAIVAVEAGLRLLYSRLSFGEALFVLVLAPEFYRPLRALGAAFHAGMAGREAAERLAAIAAVPDPLAAPAVVETTSPVVEQTSARSGPAFSPRGWSERPGPQPGRPPAIRFDEVCLSYAAGGRPALDGLTLELPSAATVALVGPTGSGKTTIANLLLRFLEPDRGSLAVDGVPLATMPPEAWRERVAWVPQRPRLLHASLRDNLLIARPAASQAELERAVERAALGDLVRALPAGLDTPVGERGERLSGGEAQRVALARAFLKDAPVLVLDEPTAQLDTQTEAAVLRSLRELRRDRTVLLVAHRLTTVMAADRVVLLAAGRVAEQGAPDALARVGPHYRRLLAAWGAGA